MFGDLPVGFLAFKGSDMGYLKKKEKKTTSGGCLECLVWAVKVGHGRYSVYTGQE